MVRFADFGRFDPLPVFRFRVSINGQVIGHFSEVNGLSMETNAIDYREGGDPTLLRKVPGLTSSGDITLRRGLSENNYLEVWYSQVFDVTGVDSATPDIFRRLVTVTVLKRGGVAAKGYSILRAWPRMYKPGDFNATENSIAIEEVTLANEGFKSFPVGGVVLAPPIVF